MPGSYYRGRYGYNPVRFLLSARHQLPAIPCCLLPVACFSVNPLLSSSTTFQTTSKPTNLPENTSRVDILNLRVEIRESLTNPVGLFFFCSNIR